MRIFSISGYFIDDKSKFDNYLVVECDQTPEGYDDEDIFFYGLGEEEIKESIKTKAPIDDFVITSYAVIDKKEDNNARNK